MFDTKQEILDQLRAGEDSRAEFKEVRLGDRSVVSPNTEDMAGELVAFSNADGGVVFLGVEDGGSVRGLPKDRLPVVEQWIVNVAMNNCEPPIRPLIRREVLSGPDGSDCLLVLVEVKRGLYAHRTSGGRYYLRVGSTKQDLAPQALARLFQQRGRAFIFDEQPVWTAVPEDLDLASLRRFFGAGDSIPWHDLLRNTRVIAPDEEGIDRPTVAGLLTFGSDPQQYLPSAYIEAAIYRGEQLTSDDLVHQQRIGGRVDDQIDDAVAFVDRFMLKPARKPLGREDYPQYDIRSVQEAVVNAAAHRDYSLSGAKIRLFLFADRLELYSPGNLPNSLTIDTMPYRVFTRNQLLVGFLSRMRSRRSGRAYLESRGEGVRLILSASEQHAGRRPVYDLFGEELRLTIWAKPSPHAEVAGASD
jgi:predicted HTH transcriptional regulator